MRASHSAAAAAAAAAAVLWDHASKHDPFADSPSAERGGVSAFAEESFDDELGGSGDESLASGEDIGALLESDEEGDGSGVVFSPKTRQFIMTARSD